MRRTESCFEVSFHSISASIEQIYLNTHTFTSTHTCMKFVAYHRMSTRCC